MLFYVNRETVNQWNTIKNFFPRIFVPLFWGCWASTNCKIFWQSTYNILKLMNIKRNVTLFNILCAFGTSKVTWCWFPSFEIWNFAFDDLLDPLKIVVETRSRRLSLRTRLYFFLKIWKLSMLEHSAVGRPLLK
jgi:hypothetical protein